jgi:hypothetical protein
MAHNLYLGMYTFSIKKKNTRNAPKIDNNDFLEKAYAEIEENKFEKGFVQDIVSLFDEKAYKNAQNTHGAILDDKKLNSANRTLDILIDGGLTGIKQFLIDEEGKKQELSDEDIVGLKFYARFWLPAGSKTAYIFIQKYGTMSIKPIFDSIILDLLNKYELTIFDSKLKATTTKARLKKFLTNAALKNVTIVSNSSINSTGSAEASVVEVKLKNFRTFKKVNEKLDLEAIRQALDKHGFIIGDKKYEIKGTYEYSHDGVTEERTAKLDATDETINIVPNIVVPPNCVDSDNYPIFDEMIKLTNSEMEQVKTESKL